MMTNPETFALDVISLLIAPGNVHTSVQSKSGAWS